jgi:hypothetical protein
VKPSGGVYGSGCGTRCHDEVSSWRWTQEREVDFLGGEMAGGRDVGFLKGRTRPQVE